MNAPRQPARAEVVGSLLCPQRLLDARAGGNGALDEIVDAEIRAAVARQVELGLDVVTDGEFARAAFTHSFYSALRHLPAGKIAALGIVSSKHPPVETRKQLVREIEQAARHVDVGRLAISPQCGFASVSEGNELSPDDQWRKLEVVARTADEVWGPAG